MINYIKENYKTKTDKEIAKIFSVDERKITNARQKLRLLRKNTPHKYTKAEYKFLEEHRKNMDINQLTSAFNKKFNTSLSGKQLTKVCRGHKWYCNLSLSKLNSKDLVLGRTVKQGRGRIFELILKDGKRVFVDKKRLIYEQSNGCKLKQNHLIVFLDGNKNNYEPENLYCVDRKINLMMSCNNWYTNKKEHTLTAIKLCELYFSIK